MEIRRQAGALQNEAGIFAGAGHRQQKPTLPQGLERDCCIRGDVRRGHFGDEGAVALVLLRGEGFLFRRGEAAAAALQHDVQRLHPGDATQPRRGALVKGDAETVRQRAPRLVVGLICADQYAVQIKDHCAHERIASNSSHTSRQDRGASRPTAARESASVRRSAPSACSMR